MGVMQWAGQPGFAVWRTWHLAVSARPDES
jgi:hypothetical protein